MRGEEEGECYGWWRRKNREGTTPGMASRYKERIALLHRGGDLLRFHLRPADASKESMPIVESLTDPLIELTAIRHRVLSPET